jgi:four helix bundle protein
MTYARLEGIPAWQEAMRLADGVYNITASKSWPGSRSLQDQLERAALSVSNNIAESCSRQLRGWVDYLQNAEIKGQRHLNDKSRQHYDASKKAEEFQQELLERLPPDHPLRKRPRQL